MTRQQVGLAPDMVIGYDRYELGAAEVGLSLTDTTKQLNDGSKLLQIMKCMLLNLAKYSPVQEIALKAW